MQYSAVESFTVVTTSLPFMNQAFLHKTSGAIFRNAASTHYHLRATASYTPTIGKWVDNIEAVACDGHRVRTDHVVKHPRINAPSTIECHLLATDALLAWLVSQETTNQAGPTLKKLAATWVSAMCEKAVLAHCRLGDDAHLLAAVGGTTVSVTLAGDITG